ncbi:MAG: spermidine/putrescine ABC transporter ATP-binding protein PotA [Thermodesulfobacteriota bacterium]
MENGEKKPVVSLSGISKSFDGHVVVPGIDLTVYEGEFLTLLGPSGCGKTTILRMIAGFERPDDGDIFIGGVRVNNVPPNRRDVNMVFQNYALFPHMTVFSNVAFGLAMKRKPRSEIEKEVNHALAQVKLSEFASRKPRQLSGGQQQRVALARALVNKPKVLLFDEPLNALDYRLRKEMQRELRHLQQTLRSTFVFVTHDQEEALSMSDRVAVMREGRIEQLGTPRQVYEEPRNLFVASFIGETNVLSGTVLDILDEKRVLAKVETGQCALNVKRAFAKGDRIRILLRPEDLRVETLTRAPEQEGRLRGTVVEKNYKGATLDSVILLENGTRLLASEFFDEVDEDFDYQIGEKVSVGWVSSWEVVLGDEA